MTYTTDLVAIIDEDDMLSDTDGAVPTQQSVKAYVDASSVGDETFLTNTDETGTLPNSDPLSAKASGILSSTTTTGVLTTRVLTGTASQLNVADGDGVSGNPTVSISAVLRLPGSLRFSTGITVNIVYDEDDMSSDDPNALATQQSIKAYVDSQTTGSTNNLAMKIHDPTRYHFQYFVYDDSNANLTTDRLYLIPTYLSNVTYTRIGLDVSGAGSSGHNLRLGIYDVGTTGLPNDVVLDAGEIDVETTGEKEATISFTPDAGWYFLALHAEQATNIQWGTSAPYSIKGSGRGAIDQGESGYQYISRSYASGFENPLVTSLTYQSVTAATQETPTVWLRIV